MIASTLGTPGGPLPELRKDVQFETRERSSTGEPVWTICDPLNNSFFRIDHQTRRLLQLWLEAKSYSQLAQNAESARGCAVAMSTLVELGRFLVANKFADIPDRGWREVAREAE